jgi:hypothetical protein
MFLFTSVFFIDTYSQLQDPIGRVLSTLTAGPIPDDLLATKTIALYDPSFSTKELSQIQTIYERTGVDAVIYYPMDLPMCNTDVQKVFSDYLTKREIKYFCFLLRKSDGYEFVFTEFNKTKSLINDGQLCWKMTGGSIQEVAMDIYRTALNSQKRVNMLVSPIPEFDLKLRFIKGTRGEYYGVDLKIDKLGIVMSGDESVDTVMVNLIKEHYPFKYQFFEAGTAETSVRDKGCLFVLSFIHARGSVAMELLGYNTAKGGSAITSVSYPNGDVQLKTIDANQPVYKFYFKHLVNENVFLGTRWDADTSWQQALINQIKGLKKELRVN